MLRLLSCRHATLLIEQRADAPLAPRDRRSLWLHLRYCPYCHRYAHQTVLLVLLAQARAAGAPAQLPGLPDAARQRIRQQLAGAGLDAL
ncbi:hypothetical protein [Hymenobacter sp. PAMC 26628]|uniref:anti-sigma factor family protein n=1 Tax=Hymenobacter sp. PAMC 26628 TaxID=1484118 RepID=UPI0007700DDB|nr:hypothetical protein [Hymenobacter sp. PAMC 26628]AMJ64862.1 hypothetical protein AXW84_05020 [Hymenobacter sp. PAMC 26628]